MVEGLKGANKVLRIYTVSSRRNAIMFTEALLFNKTEIWMHDGRQRRTDMQDRQSLLTDGWVGGAGVSCRNAVGIIHRRAL